MLQAALDYEVLVDFAHLWMVFFQVLTWGYKMVTPRRVIIARDIKKRGSCPLKFHKKGRRDQVVAIAAGMTHSTIVAEDGLIFYWVSADPNLRTHQVKPEC